MDFISNVGANFVSAIAQVGDMALGILWFVMIIRCLISWFSPDPNNTLVQILYRITEPILNPIRRLIPMSSIGIDISPIIAFFAIIFLRTFLIQSLMQLAQYMRSLG